MSNEKKQQKNNEGEPHFTELEWSRLGGGQYAVKLDWDNFHPKFEEISDLSYLISQKRNDLRKAAAQALGLPSGCDVVDVEKTLGGGIIARVKFGNVVCEQEKLEKPEVCDPYAEIRKHPQLIQLLNCGALTKQEKRRVLGLPGGRKRARA